MFGLAYVVAVLNIEEAPETVSSKSSCTTNAMLEHIHRHDGIDDCEPPIEG